MLSFLVAISQIPFGNEADFNRDYFVYFDEEYVKEGDLHSRRYDGQNEQWVFVISDGWANSHPGCSEKGNWFLTVECQ